MSDKGGILGALAGLGVSYLLDLSLSWGLGVEAEKMTSSHWGSVRKMPIPALSTPFLHNWAGAWASAFF